MKYLLVAPQLGFETSGRIVPGGLLQFGRCVARALASSPQISKLGVWCQVDLQETEYFIRQMLQAYAHPKLVLDVRAFGASRFRMGRDVAWANLQHHYDQVMYLLVNQAQLALMPQHRPYTVWEIGRELFEPISWSKRRALRRACQLLSISHSTACVAAQNTTGLPPAQVVHLCVEPPLFGPEKQEDANGIEKYDPARRNRAVLIVANLHKEMLYKGHQQLIAAWGEVVENCPEAELWIAGDGSGRSELEGFCERLPEQVANRIKFLGFVDDEKLTQLYRRCRAFAMPSSGEGFGLVFVEAARYGVPCIGGKYDSAKEVIIHNETGLLVEQHPHDVAVACLTLLTDDHLAGRLGAAAQERYLTYFRFVHFRQRLLQALGMA